MSETLFLSHHHQRFNCYHHYLTSLLSLLSWLSLSSSLLSLLLLATSWISLSEVTCRIQCFKETCFHSYVQKAITNLAQKMMSASKTELKNKYEIESSSTPVNKRGKSSFSASTSNTHLFATSTRQATQKKLSNLQKQKIYKIENCECPSAHPI